MSAKRADGDPMRLLLKSLASTLLVVLATAPASAQDFGELSRSELLEGLTTILSNTDYYRRLPTSAGELSFESGVSWGDEPVPDGWSLSSVTTARLEGCVVTIHLEKPGFCEKATSGWDTKDDVIDLRFIGGAASVRPPSDGYSSLGASVKYPFRREIARRLLELSGRAMDILNEGMARFPSDVPERMDWLAERYSAELTGEVLEGSHQRVHHCSQKGAGFVGPSLNTLDVTFYVDPERAGEFAALMDEYRGRYCQVLDDAAIQRIDFRMQE